MKKFLSNIFFSLLIVVSVSGQQLNEYKYVKVPEKFDFLKEKDQFQLNALTAFLFEKYGFNVIFIDDSSLQVKPCEVLEADVHKDSGLLKTKLFVTLQNCKNETVFTSATGESREKDYKTGYHEALRDAFQSIERLNYSYEAKIDPIESKREKVAENIEVSKNDPEVIIVDPRVASRDIKNEAPSSDEKNLSVDSDREFTNASSNYILKSTTSGFELFKKGENGKFGVLLKSESKDYYLYASKKVSGNAFFDTQGNLIVEYVDFNTEQLISLVYKLVVQ